MLRQHQQVITMSLVSIETKDFAMDMKKFWVGIGKFVLIFNLQVILYVVVDYYNFWNSCYREWPNHTYVFNIRHYILCTYHWNGYENRWSEWRQTPCFGDNFRWSGIYSFLYPSLMYIRTYVCMYVCMNTCMDVCRVFFEQITKTRRNTWLSTILNITC